jgi:dimethylhistidine N-methyltransferase
VNVSVEAQSAEAAEGAFLADVLEGLGRARKTLPCRYFYDARGSELFEEITRLPEYYPTRVEAAVLRTCARQIAARTPAGAVLIEFGSGSSLKTEILLAELDALAAYVAIDVSHSALDQARARLVRRFPDLRVETIVGDFNVDIELPADLSGAPRLGFFPGSTIGNLEPAAAEALLKRFARTLARSGRLVIGVDVEKDPDILIPAYDDAQGVTAAFNLNILARINRELGGDFDLSGFRHAAVWNGKMSRIEMHIVSLRRQEAHVGGRAIRFEAGESIHTENSHKWPRARFAEIAGRAGWRIDARWSDPDGLFDVLELRQAE